MNSTGNGTTLHGACVRWELPVSSSGIVSAVVSGRLTRNNSSSLHSIDTIPTTSSRPDVNEEVLEVRDLQEQSEGCKRDVTGK